MWEIFQIRASTLTISKFQQLTSSQLAPMILLPWLPVLGVQEDGSPASLLQQKPHTRLILTQKGLVNSHHVASLELAGGLPDIVQAMSLPCILGPCGAIDLHDARLDDPIPGRN